MEPKIKYHSLCSKYWDQISARQTLNFVFPCLVSKYSPDLQLLLALLAETHFSLLGCFHAWSIIYSSPRQISQDSGISHTNAIQVLPSQLWEMASLSLHTVTALPNACHQHFNHGERFNNPLLYPWRLSQNHKAKLPSSTAYLGWNLALWMTHFVETLTCWWFLSQANPSGLLLSQVAELAGWCLDRRSPLLLVHLTGLDSSITLPGGSFAPQTVILHFFLPCLLLFDINLHKAGH